MPTPYAWEAAEPTDPAVVHAVTILDRHGGEPQGPLDSRSGDRNTQTLCGRKVGQFADTVQSHARTAPGLLGYRRRYRTIRVVPHLRLRRRSELAHLPRCQNCVRTISARWRVESQAWRDEHGGPDLRLVESLVDLPPFPETPVIVGRPAPAPYPTYYRYFVDVSAGTTLTGARLPSWWSWLPPTGTTLVAENTHNTTWDVSVWGQDWHQRYVANPGVQLCTVNDVGPVGPDLQAAIAERRAHQQVEWMRRVHGAIADGVGAAVTDRDLTTMWTDMNAMELVRDVCGPEALESLREHGWIDVASGLNPEDGYRIRPWKRVGNLRRGADGSWRELPVSFCIHPDDTFPMGDEIATLWLLLRFNEAEFLRTANPHQGFASPSDRRRAIVPDGRSYVGLLAEHAL